MHHDTQLRFLEDAAKHLNQQLTRQLDLCRQLLDREEAHPHLREIQQSTRAVTEQLSQLVDFARELTPATAAHEFSIEDTLALAVELVEPGLEANSVNLTLQVHPSLEGLWLGDPVRWRQIVVNTLSTCVQNCPSGNLTVSVSTSRPDGQDLVARLVFSGATLDFTTMALIHLRHTVEKLGGRIFMTGTVYSITMPLQRPLSYQPVQPSEPLLDAIDLALEFELGDHQQAAGPAPLEKAFNSGELAPRAFRADNPIFDNPWAEPFRKPEPPPAPEPEPQPEPAAPNVLDPKVLARARKMLHELAAQEDWHRLESEATELLEVVPECLQTLQHLSLARVRQDNWNGAFPILRRLAMRYLETDNVEAARDLLNQMLASIPDPATGLQIAEDCLQQGEIRLAEAFFQAAADGWFAQGAVRPGLEALQRLQLLKPHDLPLSQAIGNGLMRLGEHRQAVSVYRGMLRVQPSHRGALEGLGQAADLTGDEDLAELVRRRLSRPASRASHAS